MNFLKIYKEVLESEANSLLRAMNLVTEEQIEKLVAVYDYLQRSNGKLIISGVGKSGHIGVKIASTFASLGLQSFFVHPTEALHGDLGRVGANDAIILLSKSGTTEEIEKLIPFLKIPKELRIGLLGNPDSSIASECGIVFDCSVEREACINNQAPTNSSTLALAVGDALSVIYENYVGLSKEGFASNHPGGILGKSLSLKVKSLMIPKDDCPCLSIDATLQDAVLEMTRKNYGLCFVVDGNGSFKGILVEGDFRRAFSKSSDALTRPVKDFMNTSPISIHEDKLAFDALKLMEDREKKIDVLPVLKDKEIIGLIRLHDILKMGFSKNA